MLLPFISRGHSVTWCYPAQFTVYLFVLNHVNVWCQFLRKCTRHAPNGSSHLVHAVKSKCSPALRGRCRTPSVNICCYVFGINQTCYSGIKTKHLKINRTQRYRDFQKRFCFSKNARSDLFLFLSLVGQRAPGSS